MKRPSAPSADRQPAVSRLRVAARAGLVPLAVFVLGVGCTCYVAMRDSNHTKTIGLHRFERMCDQLQAGLTERLQTHRFLIESARSTFNASDWVSREEFQTIASSHDIDVRFPAADGLGYLRWVSGNDASVEEFLRRTRADGAPRFQLRPTQSFGRTDQPRAVVEYFGPTGADEYEGLSVEGDYEWSKAIAQTQRSGVDAITGPIQRPGGAGFVWLAPVFKQLSSADGGNKLSNEIDGWVFMPISAGRLLEGLTESFGGKINLKIFDATTGRTICDETQGVALNEFTSLNERRSFSVGGRVWVLLSTAAPDFAVSGLNPATLAWGVALSLAIALLVHTQSTATSKAEAIAREMTGELAEREVQLREAAQRTDLALSCGGLGLWDWDLVTGEVIVDRQTADLIGENYLKIEPSFDWWTSRIHPDDQPQLREAAEQHCADTSQPYSVEYRYLKPDGSYQWLHSVGRLVERDADGTPRRMVGTQADVTARVLATMASREESSRATSLAKIITESPNELYVLRQSDLGFELVNDGAVVATGYTRDELLRMSPADVVPGGSIDSVREKLQPLVRGEVSVVEFQAEHQKKGGGVYPVQVSLHPAVFHNMPVFVAFITDLSELQLLEGRLAQAQKLESIGQLAAGIAHEINTPMQCVSNNVDFLTECHDRLFQMIDALLYSLNSPAKPWEERRQHIADLLEEAHYERLATLAPAAIADAAEAARRVVEIVRAMKAMAHPGSRAMSETDVNDILRNAATISRNRWKYVADLEMELDDQLPAIPGLPAELNQVFLNLIVNAADAIAEKPENDEQRGRITLRSRQEGDLIRIEVDDTGAGIPKEIRDRVFDPFFTTKEVGKGTGQGLSITYDVVVNLHGGTIDLLSTEGEGTTFVICLPLESATRVAGNSTGEIVAPNGALM